MLGSFLVCLGRLISADLAFVMPRLSQMTFRLNGQTNMRLPSSCYFSLCFCRDKVLMGALAAVGLPLPSIPSAARQLLLQRLPCAPNVLTPGHLRARVRQAAGLTPGGGSSAAPGQDLTQGQATALLLYCLSDLEDQDPNLPNHLAGLPLVPMRDGTLAAFSSPMHTSESRQGQAVAAAGGTVGRHCGGSGGSLFLAAEADEVLLAAAPQLLIDRASLDPDLTAR